MQGRVAQVGGAGQGGEERGLPAIEGGRPFLVVQVCMDPEVERPIEPDAGRLEEGPRDEAARGEGYRRPRDLVEYEVDDIKGDLGDWHGTGGNIWGWGRSQNKVK